MTFWDNVLNGFRKLNLKIWNYLDERARKNAIEKKIRDEAKLNAEPEYWKQRRLVIKEQEIQRAKSSAGRVSTVPQFSDKPLLNSSKLGGSMNDIDFLGTKKNKDNTKEQKQETMMDVNFR